MTTKGYAQQKEAEPAPQILDLPIGIRATGKRKESDSLGDVEVAAERYWGARTERSLYAASGRRPRWKDLMAHVANEVVAGRLDSELPLYVWQTGSGTQSNMNVNEVISNRAIQLVGGTLGSKQPVHPNDDVNMGQSSNDTFPTAMHIATVLEFSNRLTLAVAARADAIRTKAREWVDVVETWRTHLQDATPLSVGRSGRATRHSLMMRSRWSSNPFKDCIVSPQEVQRLGLVSTLRPTSAKRLRPRSPGSPVTRSSRHPTNSQVRARSMPWWPRARLYGQWPSP